MKGCGWMTDHLTAHTIIIPMSKKIIKLTRERERFRQTDRERERHTHKQRNMGLAPKIDTLYCVILSNKRSLAFHILLLLLLFRTLSVILDSDVCLYINTLSLVFIYRFVSFRVVRKR